MRNTTNTLLLSLQTEHYPLLPGKEKWMWAITLKEKPEELIRAVELVKKANPANRGFWLGEPFWGKGYMTEAVIPITDYAFNELGFQKLIFENAVGNSRSRRIKEKTGAKYIKTVKNQYVDPELTEGELFELTASAWRESRAYLLDK